ncbi:hypothetical protein JYQ78_14140, partial [Anaerobutyricum hallii]|uniref:hypothetical protein n=1 Tax=Anaerobutyricum hallii TaxID=39488 RepID=UPI001ADDD714
ATIGGIKMLPDIQPGNTKILYFFNCLLDGMHTKIILICDFSRCGLNTRLHTLVSKPCSEATNKDYFISRGLYFGWKNKIRILMLERFEGGFRRL